MVCACCGSDKIQEKAWIEVKSQTYAGPTEKGITNQWCPECDHHVNFMSKEEYDKTQ